LEHPCLALEGHLEEVGDHPFQEELEVLPCLVVQVDRQSLEVLEGHQYLVELVLLQGEVVGHPYQEEVEDRPYQEVVEDRPYQEVVEDHPFQEELVDLPLVEVEVLPYPEEEVDRLVEVANLEELPFLVEEVGHPFQVELVGLP